MINFEDFFNIFENTIAKSYKKNSRNSKLAKARILFQMLFNEKFSTEQIDIKEIIYSRWLTEDYDYNDNRTCQLNTNSMGKALNPLLLRQSPPNNYGPIMKDMLKVLLDTNIFISMRNEIDNELNEKYNNNKEALGSLRSTIFDLIKNVSEDINYYSKKEDKEIIQENFYGSDEPFIITLWLLHNCFENGKNKSTLVLLLMCYALFDKYYNNLFKLFDITEPNNETLYSDIQLSLGYYNRIAPKYTRYHEGTNNDITSTNSIFLDMTFLEFISYHIHNNENIPKKITIVMQSGNCDRALFNMLNKYTENSGTSLKIVVNSEQSVSQIRKNMVEEGTHLFDHNACIEGLREIKKAQICITDIPILHSIIWVQYEDTKKDAMHVHFYTYSDKKFDDNLKVILHHGKYYDRYKYEIEYIIKKMEKNDMLQT